MINTQQNDSTIFKFLSTIENKLTGRKAKIVFEDGSTHVFSFIPKSEIVNTTNESCEIIQDYQLLDIEDGLFHLVYVHDKAVITGIIDLHRNLIEFTSVIINDNQYEICKKSGSFEIMFDSKKDLITNEEKAVDFWTRFFDKHDETAIDDYLAEPYLQHNPNVADGVEAFRNEFHERFKTDMKECSTVVKRVSSRDNLVFIHNILKRSPYVKGHAAVDIFRFENGKIVEHWDVIQPMPEKSKNDHPMF